MKTKRVLVLSALAVTAVLGTYALAHGTNGSGSMGGFHMGGMMHGNAYGQMHENGQGLMGHMQGNYANNYDKDYANNYGMNMGMGQFPFDVSELTVTLNLSNEQISILSQLEASHVVMQGIMQSHIAEMDNIGHGEMMQFMAENAELMNEHHNLYQQFFDSLNEEQRAQW